MSTVTPEVVNAARNVLVICGGAGKLDSWIS
jgi:hypothetical protein